MYPRVLRLSPNGSGTVRIDTLLLDLTNESQAQQFEAFRTGEETAENFKVVLELNWELDDVNQVVERSLTHEIRVRTEDRGQYGFLHFVVVWDNLAKRTEEGFVVEDSLLDEVVVRPRQEEQPPVRVVPPEGYDVQVDGPAPDRRENGTATWQTASRLTDVALTFVQPTPTPTATATATPTPTPTTTPVAPGSGEQQYGLVGGVVGTPVVLVGGAGSVVAVAGVGLLWARRRESDSGTAGSGDVTDAGGDAGDDSGPGAGTVDDSASASPGSHRGQGGSASKPGGSDRGPHLDRAPDHIENRPNYALAYEAIEKGRLVSRGETTDVYRASVDRPGETLAVAVKEPRVGRTVQTETVERLRDEADTWDKLDDHDHIVEVLDYGSEPLPWIAMEYMDAGTLTERLGTVSFAEALWIATAIVDGIAHAHNRGVVHLDLKPANVLFASSDGAWDVPKVADWGGSARLLDAPGAGDAVTPMYAAPEQFGAGDGQVDARTDVFQAGIVCYELFTGVHPFETPDGDYPQAILHTDPAPPSEVASVPRRLDDVLLTALAKRKADRYESILYLRDELRALAENGTR
jgi:hypothetical protein